MIERETRSTVTERGSSEEPLARGRQPIFERTAEDRQTADSARFYRAIKHDRVLDDGHNVNQPRPRTDATAESPRLQKKPSLYEINSAKCDSE